MEAVVAQNHLCGDGSDGEVLDWAPYLSHSSGWNGTSPLLHSSNGPFIDTGKKNSLHRSCVGNATTRRLRLQDKSRKSLKVPYRLLVTPRNKAEDINNARHRDKAHVYCWHEALSWVVLSMLAVGVMSRYTPNVASRN